MTKKTKKPAKAEDLQPASSDANSEGAPESEISKVEFEEPLSGAASEEAEISPAIGPASVTEANLESAESEALPAAEIEDRRDAEAEVQPAEDDRGSDEAGAGPEFNSSPRPPARLERLQKILAQAGVASRRKAEELIEQGRVQVNGAVVTQLGTKADSARDHIRVDGKLLQGAERLRYFVLNKPKGFVTTVRDPEGRPTVMQFFEKMRERLYPVGRLDYMSEGLLLVTNDGELANRLTRASAGVEKTYLVKVAGQPSEGELNLLRGGVSIARGGPGSTQVRTSPARIRQVRQGDNPWYEVVLTEGRNRELRKMFEEIGHFVEKIRRVGYGPLVLDQEPGNLRELDPQELDLLRKAAEGKLRTPKSKEVRRRNVADAAQLPTLAPRPSPPRPAQPSETGPAGNRPKKFFAQEKGKPFRPSGEKFRTPAGRAPDRGPGRAGDRPLRSVAGPAKFGSGRPHSRSEDRPNLRSPSRPAWKRDDRPSFPPSRFAAGSTPGSQPYAGRRRPARSAEAQPAAGRAFPAKPAWKKPESTLRPPYKRPPAPRPGAPSPAEAPTAKRPSRLQIDAVGPDRPSSSPPAPSRSSFARPGRPFHAKGGLARPFTTSSGKLRAGGARPGSKPGSARANESRPANRPFRRDGAEGSFAARSGKKSGWKPKPNFGGAGKPAGGARSKPRQDAPTDRSSSAGRKPGGFSKSGYKGKPGGGKRSAAHPSGKRPGGKKRG